MPRMTPPAGWITGKEVTERLNITNAMLGRYVEAGKIHKYVPPGRTYGFYNEEDVKALEEIRVAFPDVRRHQTHRSFFTIANRADIAAISKMDHDAIHPGDQEHNDAYFSRWQAWNPETLFALRSEAGQIVGFVSILPIVRNVLDRFIAGQISPSDFKQEDIPLFQPGNQLHLYVIAMAVDPRYPLAIKHEYGAALLTGFFSFLISLAERGVQIETITARSHTRDGIMLMRKLGLPWLVSPVPGMELFSVRVSESGMPFLRRYQARLEQ